MFSRLFFFLFLTAFALSTHGFSTGAPKEACKSMTPNHDGVSASDRPAPYNFFLNKKHVKSGDTVELTISGKTPTDRIKGFLIRAWDVNAEKYVGTFTVEENDQFVQYLDCEDIKASAVTHKKHDGVGSFSVSWNAPEDLKGEVAFYTTIVMTKHVFWVGVASEKLKVE